MRLKPEYLLIVELFHALLLFCLVGPKRVDSVSSARLIAIDEPVLQGSGGA
jgi:hypothetical protein